MRKICQICKNDVNKLYEHKVCWDCYWEDIDKAEEKKMKGIYKFCWDCGRMGSLEGIFVDTEAQVANLIGKRIYFGEVLGKHSEISGDLQKKDLVLLTRNPDFIELFEKHKMATGYNPFDYVEEEE